RRGGLVSRQDELVDGEVETRQGSALVRGWRLLPRCFPYIRPYRVKASGSVLLTILLTVVTLAEPWPLALVIDSVLGDKGAPGWITDIVGEGSGSLILAAVVGSLILTVLAGGLTVVNEYLTTSIDQRMVLDFRSDLFQHVQRLSLAYHDDARTGTMMYRINNQAGSLGSIVVSLPDLAQSALTVAGMAFIAYRIDPYLALLALAVVPIIFYSTTFYANRIEPRLLRVRGMEAMNLAIVHEALAMLRVVLAFGRENYEFKRFRRQAEATVDARVKLTVRQTLFRLAVSFATAAGTAAVLGVGAHRVLNGHLTAGELLVLLAYVAAVYTPLETLSNTLATFQQYFIGLEHALELMDTPRDVTEKPDARGMGRAKGRVTFEGIGFGYSSRPDVLGDVSFEVEAGHAIAIVGPTGAGKSTLVSLIPRFYDPHEGRALIDGIDVGDLKLAALRRQFSIVLQEPLLFSGTVGENIRYGRPGASHEEMVEAAKAANAHDFIVKLPDGYKTRVGERGSKLSGGERQRIAVARAFLRDAPILILDEPTSSIDSKTEAVILDALDRLMVGRTTILIAHRLSTVRHVDEILVLDHGRLVQRGTHDALVSERGLYRQLWEAQTHHRRGTTNGDGRRRPLVALRPRP
ncbi:MAG: ABC transporter ATP-binding protein, partial [Acidimicrobiales bacterium]